VSAAADTAHVPTATRLTYGFGAVAYGIKDNGFSVFLLIFYNQVIGLPAAWVGLMLLIPRSGICPTARAAGGVGGTRGSIPRRSRSR